MSNILLFSGSLRQHSYHRRLVHYLAKVLEGRCHTDILSENEFSFPLYNEDLEESPELVEHVATVYERFRKADGIIIASPEYNGHVSSYLKNTIDWVSRIPGIHHRYYGENAFFNKPVLLTSTSPGRLGGLLGTQSARPLFVYLGCLVSPAEICISNAENRFPEGRDSIDKPLEQSILMKAGNFLSMVEKMKS